MEVLEKDRHNNIEAHTQAFLKECKNIVNSFSGRLNRPIYDMDHEEQDKIVDRLNAYLKFEYTQTKIPRALPIHATGHGVLFACDEHGTVLGAEIISDGIVIAGKMSAVVSLPVPSLESLIESGKDEIVTVGQVLSPIVMIDDAKYMAGLNENGEYGFVHDLSPFQVGLAMAHSLTFSVVD